MTYVQSDCVSTDKTVAGSTCSWCTLLNYTCTLLCAYNTLLCATVLSPVAHSPFNMQFESEFRRFNVDRTKMTRFDAFSDLVRGFFRLPPEMHITMSYTDPRNSDLLPINNDDNLQRAFSTAMPLLRVFIYREQGESGCDQAQAGY